MRHTLTCVDGAASAWRLKNTHGFSPDRKTLPARLGVVVAGSADGDRGACACVTITDTATSISMTAPSGPQFERRQFMTVVLPRAAQ